MNHIAETRLIFEASRWRFFATTLWSSLTVGLTIYVLVRGTEEFLEFTKIKWISAKKPSYDLLVKISKEADPKIEISNPSRLKELLDSFAGN